MPKSVALIRGVGGPTALKMAELRSALEDSGLVGVTTLQVAGNILFDQRRRSATTCAALIRRTVRDSFGHDLPVIIRTHAQLVDAVRRNPFVDAPEGRLVMTVFLDRAPALETVLVPPVATPDVFAVDGSEAFIRYATEVAGSKLQSTWFEKRLGVVGTARNANTIAKLVHLTA